MRRDTLDPRDPLLREVLRELRDELRARRRDREQEEFEARFDLALAKRWGYPMRRRGQRR